MPWWGWLIIIIIGANCFYFFLMFSSSEDKEEVEARVDEVKKSFEQAQIEEVKKTFPQLHPSEFPEGWDYEKYTREFYKVDDLVSDEKPQAALNRIEKILPMAPEDDYEELAQYIAESFEMLCDEKKPTAILKIYDKLSLRGDLIPFAEKYGHLPDMADALAQSLSQEIPEDLTKAKVTKLFTFLEQDHPLTKALVQYDTTYLDDLFFFACQEYDVEEETLTRDYAEKKDRILRLYM